MAKSNIGLTQDKTFSEGGGREFLYGTDDDAFRSCY